MQTVSKTYGLRECANPGCTIIFEARRTNMIYCSTGCCKEATNAKLLAKYHAKKNFKHVVRKCMDCPAKLSRYNDSDKCYACMLKAKNKEQANLLNSLGIEYIDEDAI